MTDTIFAVSTAPGKAGVAVVRVSGPLAFSSAERLCRRPVPMVRHAELRDIFDPDSGELIDSGLVIAFEEGRSFTGEKVLEYQIHGSYATQSALTDALFRMPGFRYAEAGEFSRRALENGRLDLTQLEGLADLIDAETAMQRKAAQDICRGRFSDLAAEMRAGLVRALALLESTLDFSDEDLPASIVDQVIDALRSVRSHVAAQLAGAEGAARLRSGFEVAIVGAPNSGKSTLLNAISGRDAALTSSIAGTTRDVIEVRFDLGGLPVTFLDMAGIREADDALEAMGVARAVERANGADLRVFLRLNGDVEAVGVKVREDDIVAAAKCDLGESKHGFAVSGLTGEGVDDLLAEIGRRLGDRISGASFAVRQRHVVELQAADQALAQAARHIGDGPEYYDLAAEDVKAAVRHLDRIVGKVGVEDLLDEIFSSFCIGK